MCVSCGLWGSPRCPLDRRFFRCWYEGTECPIYLGGGDKTAVGRSFTLATGLWDVIKKGWDSKDVYINASDISGNTVEVKGHARGMKQP